ncbi:MAG TPA: type II CAAX endopeptidase family protein [Candidatus Sulfotelmatobacter sp.]
MLITSALSAILEPLVWFHLLPRSELERPGFGLQISVIAALMLALYLILKLRYRLAVLRPLGWIWPHTSVMIIAPLLGVLLAAAVVLLSHAPAPNTRTMPLLQALALGLVFGPILKESFFRGFLLPVLACSLGKTLAVILTAFLFALFHGPDNLAHWAFLIGTGVAYGWIRVAYRSTTASALAHAAYNLVLLLLASPDLRDL